ncbi:hypothetical protein EVAR_60269_1 [Eumeta japonica]|uniref:Uncharacterized protein n=1 Tax=Eumeta variegata TaxID=151549 RepID=A0A4C1Z775_EUMVA|nr:hypothetical protein EVAR_60269_1 [Eumeta japonica]
MSDPKRATLITVGAPKSVKNNVSRTVRLHISLEESNESKYPELNYKELVIAEETFRHALHRTHAKAGTRWPRASRLIVSPVSGEKNEWIPSSFLMKFDGLASISINSCPLLGVLASMHAAVISIVRLCARVSVCAVCRGRARRHGRRRRLPGPRGLFIFADTSSPRRSVCRIDCSVFSVYIAPGESA